MPVIRGKTNAVQLQPARRSQLLQRMQNELSGQRAEDGPVVFEIPLDPSSRRTDILAVWSEFDGVSTEDRTGLILEAYRNRQDIDIALALGVTYEEAIDQQLLPYAVVAMVRKDEIASTDLESAMIEEGAIRVDANRLELRFPTMAMAEAAHRGLCQKLPNGYWSISYTVAQIP